jgi:hypothetical protein
MIQKVVELKLPALPENIKQRAVAIAMAITPDHPGRTWLEQFHGHTIRAVESAYAKPWESITQDIQMQLNHLYNKYFDSGVVGFVVRFENPYTDTTAQSPPHCDSLRSVAINYLIKAGGSNVLTCFYKQKRTNQDLTQAENVRYQNLQLDSKVMIKENTWVAFDPQTVHSVENVENTRIFFTIMLEQSMNFQEFTTRYSELIKHD